MMFAPWFMDIFQQQDDAELVSNCPKAGQRIHRITECCRQRFSMFGLSEAKSLAT